MDRYYASIAFPSRINTMLIQLSITFKLAILSLPFKAIML